MTSVAAKREFLLPVRIYYEDTDAGGIVYHANYLKFMERARTEWLRRLGYAQNELARIHGVFFVVKTVAIDYLSPARFDDEITVLSRIMRCGRASVMFEQNIVRGVDDVTRGHVKVGCVDVRTLRPSAIPAEVYTGMRDAAG